MEIKDLKSGMMVKLRNGIELFVLAEIGTFYDKEGSKADTFINYETDLTSNIRNTIDIIEVYEDFQLVWQRKEVPNITEDEKVILRNVDKYFKYITRDSHFELEVYSDIPEKGAKVFDFDSKLVTDSLCAFNHIFKSITFENSPILISDLLEGE